VSHRLHDLKPAVTANEALRDRWGRATEAFHLLSQRHRLGNREEDARSLTFLMCKTLHITTKQAAVIALFAS
jgi:hypothetical protein